MVFPVGEHKIQRKKFKARDKHENRHKIVQKTRKTAKTMDFEPLGHPSDRPKTRKTGKIVFLDPLGTPKNPNNGEKSCFWTPSDPQKPRTRPKIVSRPPKRGQKWPKDRKNKENPPKMTPQTPNFMSKPLINGPGAPKPPKKALFDPPRPPPGGVPDPPKGGSQGVISC